VAERRSHLLLLGLIIVALIGAALLAVPGSPIHKKPVLGLDLQGGTEVVLKAVPPRGEQVTSEGMDTAQSVMRRRVDKLGVTEPEIRKQGNDQMVIELAGVQPGSRPGSDREDRAARALRPPGRPGPADGRSPGKPDPADLALQHAVAGAVAGEGEGLPGVLPLRPRKKPGSKKPSSNPTNYKLVAGPLPTERELLDSKYVRDNGKRGEVPKGAKVMFVPG
jgi:Preprotein translocase subunit SecD